MNNGALQKRIGYVFKNPVLLDAALSHSSVLGEGDDVSNERLEFLGDAVLEMCVSERLYRAFPDMDEGAMTRRRASLVREESLCACARSVGLGEHIRMSKGEEQLGGRDKPAILSDALEAVIAAVYLDGGFEAVMTLCTRLLDPDKPAPDPTDYKTRLQEHLQKKGVETPEYRLSSQSGPPHARVFESEAYYGGKLLASGSGSTKKAAEQEAARAALEKLGVR